MSGTHTISCLLQNAEGRYYDGAEWGALKEASLYLPIEADRACRRMRVEPSRRYYIQNRKFDFHAGDGEWVIELRDAKAYSTLAEASAALGVLGAALA